jgi:cytochrome b561
MKLDRTTYWLHVGLAFTVSAQLTLSLMMEAPRPGVPIGGTGNMFFQLHRMAGLTVAILLVAHWLWQFSGRSSNGLRSLYPWLFGRSRSASSSRHPAISVGRKRMLFLAGSLQGLGLLIATVMAVTGLAMFFGMAGDGSMPDTLTMVRETHAISAILLWVYLVLHLPISFLIHI